MSQQRNWSLIAGVSLPAVLLLGFVAYSYVARGVVDPPAYDLYYSTLVDATNAQSQHATLQYSIQGGRIVVRATPAMNGVYWNQGLYRLDHATLGSTRVDIDVPADLAPGSHVLAVPSLDAVRVSEDATAPDGYRFRSGYERGPGLIGEVFYSDRRHAFTIEKLGVVLKIEGPGGGYGYGQTQFLGWVLVDD